MKQSYDEVLKRATSLPYKAVCSLGGSCVWAGEKRGGVIADCSGNETEAEATLLAHSANVLPEALRALKEVRTDLRNLNHEDLQSQLVRIRNKLKSAISKIETIEP